MKFTKDKAFVFNKVGIKGWDYGLKKEYPKVNIALVKTSKGHQTVIKSTKHPWIYFVIKGKGEFWINGKLESCKAEDLIYVPRNTPFFYKGRLEMILITVPQWEEKFEVTLGKVKDILSKKI